MSEAPSNRCYDCGRNFSENELVVRAGGFLGASKIQLCRECDTKRRIELDELEAKPQSTRLLFLLLIGIPVLIMIALIAILAIYLFVRAG